MIVRLFVIQVVACGCPSHGREKVQVPEWVTENRTIKCTEYTCETQDREVTVMERQVVQKAPPIWCARWFPRLVRRP